MPLLPDPVPASRHFTLISVDDHLIEPPDLFEGRMPAHLVESAPRVVVTGDGSEAWIFEDQHYPNIGLNAVVGRPKGEWSMEPARFDEMRKGCWDIHARIADMDVAGVWASLCFPSLIAGFAGVAFSRAKDQELGLACVRAWNDWHHEVWAGTYPERIIPLQITWINDPAVAAAEVLRNAERGFKALSFPENPVNLNLPSLQTDHWDPLLRACEETGTVVCLHTGSAGAPAGGVAQLAGAPLELATTLFPVNACLAAANWLWARIPLRFPNIKIALSEGGIGWVPLLLDRLDYISTHSGSGKASSWSAALTPAEALQRNFWFCTIDDPTSLRVRDRIGVHRIMMEVDYPHADSTWPSTQDLLFDRLRGIPRTEADRMTHLNAAELFRHPLPPSSWSEGAGPA